MFVYFRYILYSTCFCVSYNLVLNIIVCETHLVSNMFVVCQMHLVLNIFVCLII